MATIGGLSSGTSSGVSGGSSIRGYGGLASGLDRDALIEQMTFATRSKIAQQGQKKQSLTWQQDAYRSISSRLIEISNKYMSYTSPNTNLSSSDFFARNNIVAKGSNSQYVDVTGVGSNAADSFTIIGVKELAKNATHTSLREVSDSLLETGGISSTMDPEAVSNISGKRITIQYGAQKYVVSFNSGDYGAEELNQTPPDTAAALQKAVTQMNEDLKKITTSGTKTLADNMEFQVKNGKISMVATDTDGRAFGLVGGDDKLLHDLGFLAAGETMSDIEKPIQRFAITSAGLDPANNVTLADNMTFAQRVAGKTLGFTYNGKFVNIKIADNITSLEDARKSIQSGLDKAFGSGRIDVSLDTVDADGKQRFEFKTTLPGGADDDSSVLQLTSGDAGLLGKYGAFHVNYGENNRVNTTCTIGESGLAGFTPADNNNGPLNLKINGVLVEGLTYQSAVKDILDAINKTEGIGVKAQYLENSDKFILTATDGGGSGKIELESGSVAEKIFGARGTGGDYIAGTDAVIRVQYNGTGQEVDLVRDSNSFIQDGMNITIKQKFGFDASGNKIPGQEVTFESSANYDKVLSAVKDMIAAYNEISELTNDTVSTKPDRSYAPLTDEQKENMTEDQIKKWEDKAKEGILFNDTLLRSLSDDLRYVLTGANISKFEEIGITKSTDVYDNGKLVLDENKLKAALARDPENVQKLFTAKADASEGIDAGLMVKMKNVTDKYASTVGAVKGSLIEKAGSTYAATSVTTNTIYKQLKDLDVYIKELKAKLSTEQDRYIKQFSTLETLISQMNSQSGWLNQQ